MPPSQLRALLHSRALACGLHERSHGRGVGLESGGPYAAGVESWLNMVRTSRMFPMGTSAKSLMDIRIGSKKLRRSLMIAVPQYASKSAGPHVGHSVPDLMPVSKVSAIATPIPMVRSFDMVRSLLFLLCMQLVGD
jgi:hypothetical protein